MSKCGTCAFGYAYPDDLSKRICRGAPPQVTIVPTPRGVQMQNMWPLVSSTDDGCALYKAKLALDSTEGNA